MTTPPLEQKQDLPFSASALHLSALKLTAAREIAAGSRVSALIAGIVIGESTLTTDLHAEDDLTIFCTHFPKVTLPEEIRFALSDHDHDAAPPLVISRQEEVLALVPSGGLQEVELAVSAGRLRGHGIETMNAMVSPQLLCRVNGVVMRGVHVDMMVPRPGGGAIVRFSCDVQHSDLNEAGVSYEILSLPQMAVLARLTLASVTSDDDCQAKLTELQAKIDQANRRVNYESSQLTALIEQRHQKAMGLIDGMAQYMLAAVYDSLAEGSETAAMPNQALATFRKLVAEQDVKAAVEQPKLPPQKSVTLLPDDMSHFYGWHSPEDWQDNRKRLWMSNEAVLQNPWPEAPLLMLSIQAIGFFRDEILPITILFDGLPAEVEVIRSEEGRPLRLNASAPRGLARVVQRIDLISNRSMSPRDVGESGDKRKLSVSAVSATLHYEF